MRRSKKWTVIAAVLALVMTITSTAFADESISWSETFDGKAINSTFDSAATASKLQNLQPGDQFTLTITTNNSTKQASNWYLQNSVTRNLEENGGKDGSYGFTLSYNGKEILSSDSISGKGGAGLSEATNATGDIYLGKLEAGQSGTVVLTITLDPQTVDNTYMEALGKLDVLFAVEDETTVTKKEQVRKTSIKTGDSTSLLGLAAMAGGALLVIVVVLMLIKNRRKEDR